MALLTRLARPAAVVLLAVSVGMASSAEGQVLTQDQALGLAFPDADEFQRRTAYLDQARLDRVRALAGEGAGTPRGVVTHYVAMQDGMPVGVAYFDAHPVRTLDEVLMVAVGPGGRVLRVETVRFREPPEYEAPEGWLKLFQGRALGPELSLKGEIPAMTGATLTARAVTAAVRRVLALHRVVAPLAAAGPGSR